MTSTTDPVEARVADALLAARTASTAPSPGADLLGRVERTGRAHRRRRRAAAACSAAALVATGVVVAVQLPDRDTVLVGGFATGGGQVDGISPAWSPTTGLEWLLSHEDYDAFTSTHRLPSPAPKALVASPAPLTEKSARLESDARRGLPDGVQVERQDAPGGDPRAAALHVTLADGTPVEIDREPLQGPSDWVVDFDSSPAGITTPRGTVGPRAVPGTESAVLSLEEVSFGFSRTALTATGSGEARARMVVTVTPSGVITRWFAPVKVPLSTVEQWALAAL